MLQLEKKVRFQELQYQGTIIYMVLFVWLHASKSLLIINY